MQHPARSRRRRRAEIGSLDQRRPKPAKSGIPDGKRPERPPADDEQVERVRCQEIRIASHRTQGSEKRFNYWFTILSHISSPGRRGLSCGMASTLTPGPLRANPLHRPGMTARVPDPPKKVMAERTARRLHMKSTNEKTRQSQLFVVLGSCRTGRDEGGAACHPGRT